MKNPTRLVLSLGAAGALLACSVPSSGPPAVSGGAGPELASTDRAPGVGRISGTVNLRGMGAAAGLEVRVYAAEGGPQMPHWTTVTDAAGRYELALPEGRYNVLVRKPGSNLAAARFGVQANTVVDIDLVPTGTVTGKVRLAPVGLPVGTDIFVPGTGLSAKAGFDGGFILADVPVGTYRLVAVRQGYGLVQSAEFEVTPSGVGQVPELVLETVRDLRTITGKVSLTSAAQKTQGESLPGCWQVTAPEATTSPEGVLVTVFNADGETATASTGVDGSYRIEHFPAGVLTFRYEKAGYFDQWMGSSLNPFLNGAKSFEANPLNPLGPRALAITALPYPLGIGQVYRLRTAYANPPMGPYRSPEAFTWTSSAPSVVTVNQGVVTAVGTGSAVVTVTDPEDASRTATVSVSVQPFREDSVTGQLNLAGLDNPGDLRLGWSGQAAGSGLVPSAAGLIVADALCAGDYRLTWERPAGASSKLLQTYQSQLVRVPHGPGSLPQANIDLTWDWLPAGVATEAIAVESDATFSVGFKPYPGATRYTFDLLGVDGQVLDSQEGTGSSFVATASFAFQRYRLRMAQGDATGFAGETATYPLMVYRQPEFASIAPGTFVMGDANEWPNATQSVTLTRGFFMQKTHVTQGQWRALIGNDPSGFQGCGDCPVELVSWFEAIRFANALSRKVGLPEVYNADGTLKAGTDIYATTGYRLPTEAEWEYAYRAGTTTRWYNGDDESKVGDIAWFYGNSNGRTQPVAQKQPNAFGLYDMAGNGFQWTNDWYADYPGGAVTDPAGPESGSGRVIRGGTWSHDASFARAAFRYYFDPDGRSVDFGFRLARSRP